MTKIKSRFLHFGFKGCPSGHSRKCTFNALNFCIVNKPIATHHVRKHLVYPLGQQGLLIQDDFVYPLCIFGKRFPGMQTPLGRQKVIIKDINDHRRVMPVFWPKPALALFHYGMVICEIVDGTVQFNTQCNARPEFLRQITALDKITNEVACHHIWIVAGEVEVREKIHGGKLTGLPHDS